MTEEPPATSSAADLPAGSAVERDALAALLVASGATEGADFTVVGRPTGTPSSERWVLGARPDGTVVVSYVDRGPRPVREGRDLAEVRDVFVDGVLRLVRDRGRPAELAPPPPGFAGYEQWVLARDELAETLVADGCVEEVDFGVSGRPRLHRTTREAVELRAEHGEWAVWRLRDGQRKRLQAGGFADCSEVLGQEARDLATVRGGAPTHARRGVPAGERWSGPCFRGALTRDGGLPDDGYLTSPVRTTTRLEDLVGSEGVRAVCAVMSTSGRVADGGEVVLPVDARLEVVGRQRLARLPVVLVHEVDPWDPTPLSRHRIDGLLAQFGLQVRRASRAGKGPGDGLDPYVGPWG